MEISIKGYITSKKSELYSDCADSYAVNTEFHKFAISDGVSKSYFPKIWSDKLVHQYVSKKDWKDDEFTAESQKEWQSKINEIVSQPETKWFTKAQYDRKDSALATFVGLQFLEEQGKWIAQALGDSFLFFVAKDTLKIEKQLSSKQEPIKFDNFPDYLSSIGDSHKGEKNSVKGEKMKEGTFFLMTDALAEWFLKDTEMAIDKLSHIHNQEQFLVTIEDERTAGRLYDDDSALLIINLVDNNQKEITYADDFDVNYLADLTINQIKEIEEKKMQIVSTESLIEEINTEEALDNNSTSIVVLAGDISTDVNTIEYNEEGLVENDLENEVLEEDLEINEEPYLEENSCKVKAVVGKDITDNLMVKSIFDKF